LNYNKTNGTISHEVKEDLNAVKDLGNSSKSEKRITSVETADEKDWKVEEDKKELEFVHDRLRQIE
jgi:hypothetical protein